MCAQKRDVVTSMIMLCCACGWVFILAHACCRSGDVIAPTPHPRRGTPSDLGGRGLCPCFRECWNDPDYQDDLVRSIDRCNDSFSRIEHDNARHACIVGAVTGFCQGFESAESDFRGDMP